ncbi:hypothetical protein D3C77_287880 [compost metagenome]
MKMPDTLPAYEEEQALKQSSVKGYQPRRRKRKLIACLLSALFPGLGHMYLRMFLKGTTFMYFIILDISALIYFSSVRMGVNVPLLILLGLFVPVVYFYSLYDVMQSTDLINATSQFKRIYTTRIGKRVFGTNTRKAITVGMMLILGGALVFMFREKPYWLQQYISNHGAMTVAIGLIVVALLLMIAERGRKFLRTGRFTAALLLMSIGILLLIDVLTKQDNMLLVLTWWPALLGSIGIEHIVVTLWNRKLPSRSKRKVRVDIKGMIAAILAAASIFIVTQQDHYVHLWNRVSLDLAAATTEYSQEEGYKHNLEDITIPVDLDTEKVIVDAVNGNIEVKKAQIEGVIIKAVVWVDETDMAKARQVAQETRLDISEGESLRVIVKDQTYGESGRRHPRVNISITVPENKFLDMDISTSNGAISLTGTQALREVKLQTGNGNLKLWDVIGDVTAKTLNGTVELYRIFGDVNADTQGGSMKGSRISGNAVLSTFVGNISLVGAEGDVDVATRNGNITLDGALSKLHAESLNGSLTISSKVIGGNWNVYSAVGQLNLHIPEEGSYSLEASSSYGDIISNLAFPVVNKVLKGTSGDGEYTLKIEGNSDVYINTN